MITQFAVIAEEASFTKASTRLRVAQPWLSARVRKLEEQIGFRLLVRNTRNVTLTPQGAEFLQAARSVMTSVEAAEILADQLRRQDDRRLRLGVPPYSNLIPRRRQLIDRFMATHRDVSVELDVGWTLSLLKRVQSGELDLAFVMGPLENESEIESILLCEIEIDLLMWRNNPIARLKKIPPSQLAGRSIAVIPRRQHPTLYDRFFSPLLQTGARLIQVPEMNDSLLDRIRSPEQLIAASFHAEGPRAAYKAIVWRPLDISDKMPFFLIRRRGVTTAMSNVFWNMAL